MSHVTPFPLYSPFINEAEVDPENRFVLDINRLFEGIRAASDVWPFGDWPSWAKWSVEKPLPFTARVPVTESLPSFISDPSDDFIAACHRDLLPLLEQTVRLG